MRNRVHAGCTNAGNGELEWYTPAGVVVSDGAPHLSRPASFDIDYVRVWAKK